MKRFFTFLCIFLCLVLIDQITKMYTYENRLFLSPLTSTYPYGGYGVFQNMLGIDFSINYATNIGAAWGLFSHFRWTLFVLRCLLVVCLLIFSCFTNRDRFLDIPLLLILSGAIGNVFDVIHYGYVIDMFKFTFWEYEYPIFNVADALICIGVGIWAITSILPKLKRT